MTTIPDATAERIVPEHYRQAPEEQALLARHEFAYACAAQLAPPDRPLLEIGCGEGYGTRWLAERFAPVAAVDIDASAAARAATRCAALPHCRVQAYDGVRLPYPDGSMATVIALQVIEHLPEPAVVLREMARVLQPGGMAMITTPNRAYRVADGSKPWNRFHYREYTAAELAALLAPHFADVTMQGVRAAAAIEQQEKARCRTAQRLAALDPLGLRHWLTPAREQKLAGLLRRLTGRGPARATATPATVADYWLAATEPDAALDLLAVCRQPLPERR